MPQPSASSAQPSATFMAPSFPAIDLAQYWQTLHRAKWSIIGITLLSFVIGIFIAKSVTPTYMASAKILASPQQPSGNGSEKTISSALVYLFYQTQYEIIKSRKIAETVVDKLNLVEKYKAEQEALRAEKNNDGFVSAIKSLFSSFSSAKPQTLNRILSDEKIKIKLASSIQKSIKVSGGKKSQIIHLNYISSDPIKGTEIINSVAQAYIEFGLSSRLDTVKNTESWLGEQSSQLQKILQSSELTLSQYRIQQGLVDTKQQKQLAATQLQSLNKELINAQTNLSLAEEKHLAIQDIKNNQQDLYSFSSIMKNQGIYDLIKEQTKLRTKVNELFERYGEKHPKMIAIRSEFKSNALSLENEVAKVVQNIEKNYRLAQYQVNNIKKLISESRDSIQNLQTENFTLVSLEREVENNRRIYENFQLSLMKAAGNSQYNVSNVQIIDQAIVPKLPFKPNKNLIVVLAAMTGLFFSVFLSLVLEAFKNTFKTPDSIEDKLQLSNLGIVPFVKSAKHDGPVQTQYLLDPRTPFSESINTIRTGLLFSNIDTPPKTLLVTSAKPGEGKSTTAINLASAYSKLGKTLLLEVDLRKPSIEKTLNINNKLGLSDILLNHISHQEAITYPEKDKQLAIITSGTLVKNPIELLSSHKFEQLLASLTTTYEYIILDGPPVLPVSDSCIVANKVDGIIFAVKAEDTGIKVAKEALSRLQKVNANIIGSVLTCASANKMGYYGDHYYSGEHYGEDFNHAGSKG